MIGLRDFLHLPQVDDLVEAVAATPAGLILVAGHEPPAHTALLPSGRAALFRILMHRLIERHSERAGERYRGSRALRITVSSDVLSLPRALSRAVQTLPAKPGPAYAEAIASVTRHGPGLLLLEQFGPGEAPAAVEAALRGWRILAPVDSVYRGADVAREMGEGGASGDMLAGLAWVVTTCRLPMLCAACKRPVQPAPEALARVSRLVPALNAAALKAARWFAPGRCPACNHIGRSSEVMAFDFYRGSAAPSVSAGAPADGDLRMEEYIARLAIDGRLSIDDIEPYESMQLRRLQRVAGQATATGLDAHVNAQRYQAELQASRRVLHQRTQALMSLERLGLELISSTDLADLASRVCVLARDLCGIERAILYHRRPDALSSSPMCRTRGCRRRSSWACRAA